MVTVGRVFMSVLILSVVSISCDDTTIKKRRGRPKKVKIETTGGVIAGTETNGIEADIETKKMPAGTRIRRTTSGDKKTMETLVPSITLIDPLNMPTKFGINEYETYIDESGWWHDARKKYANMTTKQRRKFPTTLEPETTVFDELEHHTLPRNCTSSLERMYYSFKQYYRKPENQKKADHLARDIIEQHDKKKGISPQYTWNSIENIHLGKMKHDYLTNYEELADLSA